MLEQHYALHAMLRCYALCAMLYPLMPTHAYAYLHHRHIVPKAWEHLVNYLKQNSIEKGIG